MKVQKIFLWKARFGNRYDLRHGSQLFAQAGWNCQVSKPRRGCSDHSPLWLIREFGWRSTDGCSGGSWATKGRKRLEIKGISGLKSGSLSLSEGSSIINSPCPQQSSKETSNKCHQQHTELGEVRVRRRHLPSTDSNQSHTGSSIPTGPGPEGWKRDVLEANPTISPQQTQGCPVLGMGRDKIWFEIGMLNQPSLY